MRDNFNLHSRFETYGIFWDATDPTRIRSLSGHLSSGAHVELTTSAETAGIQNVFSVQPGPFAKSEHVLGITTDLGPCSLVGLHEIGPNNLYASAVGEMVIARRYRVSACIVGCHVATDTAPVFRSATLTCTGIDQWMPGLFQTALAEFL